MKKYILKIWDKHTREALMTLFALTESNQAAIVALQAEIVAIKAAAPADVAPVIAAAIAPVEAKVDALAALVGTPSVPAA